MKILLAKNVCDELVRAARAAYPLEACGLLAGRHETVTKCYVLTNADASADHFSMKPEEQFAAIKDMRTAGLKLLAIWHSHPVTPARMSEEDLRLAYTPDVAHVIVSLAQPDAPCVRGFVVRDGAVEEPTIELEQSEKEGSPE